MDRDTDGFYEIITPHLTFVMYSANFSAENYGLEAVYSSKTVTFYTLAPTGPTCLNPEMDFINSNLESLRAGLEHCINNFLALTGQYTTVVEKQ